MNINKLIAIVKNKLETEIVIQELKIQGHCYFYHKGHQEGKFHLKLTIKSDELTKSSKIVSTKKIYSVLDLELKEHIHSIQILLN